MIVILMVVMSTESLSHSNGISMGLSHSDRLSMGQIYLISVS